MLNSNQSFDGNIPLINLLNPSKKRFLFDENLAYDYKCISESFSDSIKDHSYTKMIIESYHTLSKSQAVEFLQQASSTESKLSLLDAMKDKVALTTEEIDELVPSTDSLSFSSKDASSCDNLSYLSLLNPQRQSPHTFTSFNNAAQPTRTSSHTNKRSSILRGLFGRYPSKKRTSVVTQPLKISQQKPKKRTINGGDQVKVSSIKAVCTKAPYQLTNYCDMNNHGDNIDTGNNEDRLSFQGLRYDFKHMKSTSTIKSSEIKQTSINDSAPVPFASQSSCIHEKSLSSLSDPTSMRQHIKEQKQDIQSAHNVDEIPEIKKTNNILEKKSFNANQHKYHTQTPNYHYSKRVPAIEILAKQYSSSKTPQNSTGLFWYSANHRTMNGRNLLIKRDNFFKKKNRSDSSSDSRDTSSSSNSSASSNSTEVVKNNTSSSSSSTSTASSRKKTSESNSNSTASSSQSAQQAIKIKGQYNRNQNEKDDLIRIDLNSIVSRTSMSTSSTSIQPCYQRSISRKQSSVNSSSSSSTTSISSPTVTIKNNNNPNKRTDKSAHKVTFNIPSTTRLFPSADNRTIGQLKVKRQHIESKTNI